MGQIVATKVVKITSLHGESKVRVDEIRKFFFSDRRMMIGYITITGPYVDGGLHVPARTFGMTTIDVLNCEGGKWSVSYDEEENIHVYDANGEVSPGSDVEMAPRKFSLVGS